jgi:hypothetical protein
MKTLTFVFTLAVSATAGTIANNGNVDGSMAVASRPDAGGKIEIEAADDFLIGAGTQNNIVSATFVGLLTGGATVSNINDVDVEIYRVFPLDSTTPPSGNVPTRMNSPSDNAFVTRDAMAGDMTFGTTVLSSSFMAANSVLNGINKFPNQATNGEGSVSGQEVMFKVNFTTPFSLPPDHYFFVPQVQVTGGEFMWLSSVRPIAAPGMSFSPDLQAWVRNENLDPDWLRVGTDIVGGTTPPTFNLAFTIDAVPEPSTWAMLAGGLVLLAARLRKRS